MTTLTLQVDNPSVLVHLKQMLNTLQGVKILNAYEATAHGSEEEPNALTLAAMEEARSGSDAGPVSLDSLDSFAASMQ